MQIVAFSGYATSGKDTAAEALTGLGFCRIAFADKLREFLYRLNPLVTSGVDNTPVPLRRVIDEYGWNGYKRTQWKDSIREMLQRLGTECGRELISDNIWVNATLDNLTEGKYSITDVRFPNEAEAIRQRGGKIYRIVRAGVGPANGHKSEISLDDYEFDGFIHNDGTVEQFHENVRRNILENRN